MPNKLEPWEENGRKAWAWPIAQLPSLDGLTALQTLNLGLLGLTSLPSLDGLTALQTLDLSGCSGLTSLPSLDGLTALQTLTWTAAEPDVAVARRAAALQTLTCRLLGLTSLPSLDGLTALQTLDLSRCSGLTSLPSLDGLTALQTLNLYGCSGLTSLPSRLQRPSPSECVVSTTSKAFMNAR